MAGCVPDVRATRCFRPYSEPALNQERRSRSTAGASDDPPAPMLLYTYEDTLREPIKLGSPSDKASSGRQTSSWVSWHEAASVTSYEIWYDTDPSFKQSPTRIYSDVARANISNLENGITYYWRVRVGQPGNSLFVPGTVIAAGAPALSRFSATWSFSTALGAAQWNPFVGGVPEAPTNGATNVPLTPSFAWNAADWATGYELVVARHSNFADVVIAKVGDNALPTAIWASDKDLDYNTTYYWKVRAISPTSNSEWAVGIFTTEPPPPASASPPPSPPAPPSTLGTPMHIWVMLAIVVVLIIALLILIITTRRSY